MESMMELAGNGLVISAQKLWKQVQSKWEKCGSKKETPPAFVEVPCWGEERKVSINSQILSCPS